MQNCLQQLKSGFKRAIKWNKYQSKVKMQAQNPYLDYLIDLSFQGLKRLFVLFMMVAYFFSFDQLVKNDMRTNDNIRKITPGQGDDYTAACLINYIIISQKLQNGSNRFK